MSRRQKDPLRAVERGGADGVDALEPVAARRRRRWRGRRRCWRSPTGRATRPRRERSDAATATPWRMGRPLQPRGPARRWCRGHGGGPPIRYADEEQRRILAEAARVPDRDARRHRDVVAEHAADGPCARPGMVCRPSAPTRSGARCAHAGLSWQKSRTWCDTGVVVRKRRDGAARSRSPTPTPPRKKADRAGLRAGSSAGAGGLVRGRGRAVPDRAASRRQLAAEGPAGDPAARVRARRARPRS